MDILETVKMAAAILVANRLRSGLTMLGMVIGNASVIAVVAVGQGTQDYASEQLESLGPNVLFVTPGSAQARGQRLKLPDTLVLEDAQAIAGTLPAVSSVAPQLQSQLTTVFDGVNTSVNVMGTSEAYPLVRDHDVSRGRFLSQQDVQRGNLVAVLGSEFARRLKGPEDPIGKKIRIKNLSFEIIGLLEEKGAILGTSQDDVILIPLSTMANRVVGSTSPYGTEVDVIAISAKEEANIPAAKFQVRNLLRLRHKIINEDDFTIQTQKQALEVIGNISGALTVLLVAIASISLLVGGIGIMNIMLVSVTERVREIGLRKAIGASQSDILMQFMVESIILSAAGGTIGILVGVGGILLVDLLTPLNPGIPASAVVLAVGVSGGTGLFFGIIPARRAARLDPIVALRSA